MTANADYGVSIVESFAPTPEWLPGQNVNKDVYATNTGSIAALVKEEIDTRIAIKYEVDQAKWDANCVELTEEERYAIEAGSFLAYRPSDSDIEPGIQIVTRPEDNEGNVPKATDFTPDKDGLYVFRRSIDVDAADQSETFTYDGYYFKGNKYYKVSNLNDNVYQDSHVVADNTSTPWVFKDYMGDGINDDGTLMVAGAAFRKEIEEYVDPMNLTYLKLSDTEVAKTADNSEYSGMDAGQYLVATYDRGNNTAMAAATAAAEAYDKAIHEFEYAEALYNAALAEYTTAHDTDLANADKALNGDPANPTTTPGATKNLTDAQANYQNALAEYNNKLTAYNNALDKLKETKKVYEDSMKKLYGAVEGGETAKTNGETYSPQDSEADANSNGGYLADSLYGKYAAAKNARKTAHIDDDYAYTGTGENKGIEDEFNAYITANSSVTATAYTALDTAGLKAFRDWVDDHTTNEEHDHWMLVIDELIAKTNYDNEKAKCLGASGTSYNDAGTGTYGEAYKNALNGYKTAYTELGDISKQSEYNGYKDGIVIDADDTATTNSGAKLALDNAKTTLDGAQSAYNSALTTYQNALKASNAAEELKDAAQALQEAARNAQTQAAAAYDAVDDADKLGKSDGAVKIYIKLNDDAVITDQTGNASNEKWFLDPVTLDNSNTDVITGTLLNNKAVFYYTGLLEGGETSSKLVDYVLLDSHATQNDYKNFDFDINVALKSAQINLDESGNIKTDAAQAELAKFAKYNNGTLTSDADKVVEWSDTGVVPAAASATTYTASADSTHSTAVVPGTNTNTALSATYPYAITLSSAQATDLGKNENDVYVGASQVGTYYKVGTGNTIDNADTITVAAN